MFFLFLVPQLLSVCILFLFAFCLLFFFFFWWHRHHHQHHHHDDDHHHHDHDHHRCSWQTCAKKSEALGRVGFYFSKFEAPLDYFASSALLAILESCSPCRLARELLAQSVKGVSGPNPGPTRRLTLSSKDNISRRPGPLKVPYQVVIRTPHFYFVKLTIPAWTFNFAS